MNRVPWIAAIPSLITLLNAFCGFVSIALAVFGYARQAPHLVDLAFSFIFICVGLDIMDGLAARILNAKSSMGAHLDSLSDGLSFGLAPAMHLVLRGIYAEPENAFPILSICVGLLYLGAVLYRLARFNVAHDEPGMPRFTFQGFPSPGGGLLVMSACYLHAHQMIPMALVHALFGLAAVLMSSRIPYPDLPKQYVAGSRSRYELIVVAALVVGLGPFGGVLGFMLSYAALPSFTFIARRVRS